MDAKLYLVSLFFPHRTFKNVVEKPVVKNEKPTKVRKSSHLKISSPNFQHLLELSTVMVDLFSRVTMKTIKLASGRSPLARAAIAPFGFNPFCLEKDYVIKNERTLEKKLEWITKSCDTIGKEKLKLCIGPYWRNG